MSYLDLAALGEIALAVGYALAALVVIGVVCFALAKAFGGNPRRQSHDRGLGAAGPEEFDPDDGTPHTTDS